MYVKSIAKFPRAILSVSLLYFVLMVQTQAASLPTLVAYWDFNTATDPTKTLDKIYAFEGLITNATFTADLGGHSGLAGDRAMDFGLGANQEHVRVSQAAFMNAGAAQDQMTIVFWQKLAEVANSSAFWGVSPSSNNGQRGFQAHTPWSNNNIYFDTAGCCDPPMRINADVLAWNASFDFTQWHHFGFVKNGPIKQIWIDGVKFLERAGAAPLPTDFTRLMIGADNSGGNNLHGMEDDFAVFAGALDPTNLVALASGTAPDRIPGIIVPTAPLIATPIASPAGFSLEIRETAANAIVPGTLSLTLDANAITASSVTKVGQTTTVLYNLPANTYFPSGSAHTLNVSVQDSQSIVTAVTRSFTVVKYQVILPSWQVTPDTTKPGFVWNYFANSDSANRGNSNTRAEANLALQAIDATGASLPNLGDPNAIGAALAAAAPANPVNAPLHFEIAGVINLNKVTGAASTDRGNFTPDEQEPGAPSTDLTTDGQAAEILTYVTLPAGLTTMGVNSDDGFSTSSGPNPQDAFGRLELGAYNGGRGAADTIFYIVVQQAGTYPLRTVWENGGGDSNIELFTVKPDGTKVLVNDLTKGGIPAYRATTAAALPYVKATSPAPVPRQLERSSPNVSLLLADGGTAVNDNSVTLQIDGKNITPLTKTRQANLLTVDTGVLPGSHLSGEAHTGVLTFQNSSGSYSRTQQWTFYNVQNLIFPATPVTGENFDSYPEATGPANAVPPGWVASNFTYPETPGWDINDQRSDAYTNWVIAAATTIETLEAPALQNDTSQTINGQPVTTWVTTNVLWAASDGRAGGGLPQVQFVVTKPFDLSMVTNPVVTFYSMLRISGNRTEGDAMEYSIDGGANWLPVIYFQKAETLVVNPDGSFDAVACFTTPNSILTKWTDPVLGPRGGKLGDGILAPISQALAPYIAERSDLITSRKVEAINLPQASRKSDVRLRLSHVGSCGWWWGVDNIAFYDIAPSVVSLPAPRIDSISISAGQVTIRWSNGGTLESTPSLTNPVWTSTGNSSGVFTGPVQAGSRFFRINR